MATFTTGIHILWGFAGGEEATNFPHALLLDEGSSETVVSPGSSQGAAPDNPAGRVVARVDVGTSSDIWVSYAPGGGDPTQAISTSPATVRRLARAGGTYDYVVAPKSKITYALV